MPRTKQRRFDFYKPLGDLAEPERTGLLPCDQEFDLATPNLQRKENIQLVASNSGLSEALEVKLKWRPSTKDKLVTLEYRLIFVVGEQIYAAKSRETYKPEFSSQRPGRITQYGWKGSKLKLSIACPYRRMRFTYNGQARELKSQRVVYLKLNFVVNTTVKIFDFLDQYDPKLVPDEATRELISHDRHEHNVKLNGEYQIEPEEEASQDGQQQTKLKSLIKCWGFHSRQFIKDDQNVHDRQTKRLLCVMENGQSFHVGNVSRNVDSKVQQADFGYTAFEIQPVTVPIDKHVELDWPAINQDTLRLDLKVSGQGKTFSCVGELKNENIPQWFSVKTNDKPGWAWLSLDDELVESPDQLEAIEQSRSQYKSALESGLLASEHVLTPDDLKRLVVALDEPACSSSQLVGAKASSLAQLMAFKRANPPNVQYKVPSGFVLTKGAYELILKEEPKLEESIASLQEFVGQGGREQETKLKEECKLLQEQVKAINLPEKIKSELNDNLKRLYGDDCETRLFAVRSSSWGEDEDDMSAAGQLTTILNVKASIDELARASMECFASKFSFENLEYKRLHGLPLDLPMAVVVQEMVGCEKAGVMFTCSPTTGKDSQLLITANYGLGESVVSAQADPDSIVVRRLGTSGDHPNQADGDQLLKIESIHIGAKKVVISSASSSSSSESQDQNNLDKSKCCLSDEEILKLAQCGLRLRDYFGGQQRDIEWGYLNGEVHLFQSRPVTGIDSSYSTEELLHEFEKPSRSQRFFYSRANIGEVMPYAIKPLSLTYAVFVWGVIGNRMYIRLNQNYEFSPHCTNEVFYESYHSYFNVCSSSLLSLSREGTEKPLIAKSMEISMFGHEMDPQPDIIEASRGFSDPGNPFHGTRFNLISLPLRLMPKRTVLRERNIMVKLRSEVKSLKNAHGYKENKLLGLYNQMNSLYRHIYNCWENHIMIIMFNGSNNMGLSFLLSKYIKDPMQLSAATNKFLALSPDVISAEIPARIGKMAEIVKSRGDQEVQKFLAMPNKEALEEYVHKKNNQDELSAQFRQFLDRFGHRCYNEFELADLTWREKPQEIIEMIKTNCKQQDITSSTDANTTKRPQTIDEVFDSLNLNDRMTIKDKLILKYMLVPKCQLMLATRELTKDILVNYTDIMREATRMLAKEMQRQLRIPDADLFYYLMYDEVKPLIENHQPSIVMQALKRRQLFNKMFQETWRYDEIITDLTPNHLKPNKELDEALANAPKLSGTPASSGKVRGKICLIKSFKELDKVVPGSILLTHSTDIAFSPIFPLISGIITEVGGLISHGAVVAREYGLPSVIGIPDITRILHDGEEIILDADNGAIIRLDKPQANGSTP